VLLVIAGVWSFGPPAETWLRIAGALQERTLAPRSEFPPAAAPAPEPAQQRVPEPAPLAAAPAPEALPEAGNAPPEATVEAPPEAAAPVDVAAAPPAEPEPPEPSAQAEEPEPVAPPSAEPPPDVAAAPPSPEPAPAGAPLVAPLAPPPAGPRLSVNAEPWAEIQLDGRSVGETPIGELPIAPGPHRLRATLPDGRVIERSIEARAGDLYVVFP
jgi:hypothetical protein